MLHGAGAGAAANDAHVPDGETDLAPAHSASSCPGQITGARAQRSRMETHQSRRARHRAAACAEDIHANERDTARIRRWLVADVV